MKKLSLILLLSSLCVEQSYAVEKPTSSREERTYNTAEDDSTDIARLLLPVINGRKFVDFSIFKDRTSGRGDGWLLPLKDVHFLKSYGSNMKVTIINPTKTPVYMLQMETSSIEEVSFSCDKYNQASVHHNSYDYAALSQEVLVRIWLQKTYHSKFGLWN